MRSDTRALPSGESWQPGRSDSRDRQPVLDGIRGVAIVLVLFHHVVIYSGIDKSHLLDKALLAAGVATWLGVDLFFVLSGFLITGILYDAKGSSQYFTSFYGRRILRIFPLYYGFLALVYLAAPILMAPDEVQSLRSSQVWYWTYLSNVDVALHGWPDPTYLGHFWSLAIEEQFYLIWPFVVLMCDRRRLMLVCIACFVIALALRTMLPALIDPLAAYVLMPTRMDTLASGAFIALMVRDPIARTHLFRWAPLTLGVGIIWLALLFFARRGLSELDPVVQTTGYSVIAVTFGALIATAVDGRAIPWLRRLLCGAPLIFFGKYSYGLYVLHQPVMLWLADAGLEAGDYPRLFGSKLPGVLVFAVVSLGLSILFALASWHLWEAPFLRLKRFLPYRGPRRMPATTRSA